jgi:hypothetical protein
MPRQTAPKPGKGRDTGPVRLNAGQKPPKKGTEIFGKWQQGKHYGRVIPT